MFCAAEDTNDPTRGNYQWPDTSAGEQQALSCVHGDSGAALRNCTDDGTWNSPDLSECRTEADSFFAEFNAVSDCVLHRSFFIICSICFTLYVRR